MTTQREGERKKNYWQELRGLFDDIHVDVDQGEGEEERERRERWRRGKLEAKEITSTVLYSPSLYIV